MTALPMILQALVILLFAAGAAVFAGMLRGCLALRRMARVEPSYDTTLLLRSPLVPGISVIAAPPDASRESRDFVRRMLDLHFASIEVVLVLDGPSDAELETWTRELHLTLLARDTTSDLSTAAIRGVYESSSPLHLLVVDKEAGGEADALNAGVNLASYPVIGLIDPYCEFPPATLLRLILPMLEDPEGTVAVCGGGCVPASGGLAAKLGAVESLRTWLVLSTAYSDCRLTLPVPGAAVLVRRDALLKAGGFRSGALELLVHMHGLARAERVPYRIVCVPATANHAREPRSLAELRGRVLRDQSEIGRLWRRRKALPRGMWALGFGLPALVCCRALRPLLETVVYLLAAAGWFMGLVDAPLAALVLLTTVGLGMVLSMAAVALRELASLRGSDPARLAAVFFIAIAENLGYRQLRNLWLVAGFFSPGRT